MSGHGPSQPTIPESRPPQPGDDVGARAHQPPEQPRPVVFAHQHDRAEVNSVVVGRCPASNAIGRFRKAQIEAAPQTVPARDLWVVARRRFISRSRRTHCRVNIALAPTRWSSRAPDAIHTPCATKVLASLESGSRAAVSRVSEVAEREAPTLLTYLHERGLTPGRDIAVIEVDSVARTIRVRAGKRSVTLSHDTAAKLWVVPK